MRFSRLLLGLTGTVVATATVGPAPAHAALPWQPCSQAALECTTLTVPVDRAGTVPGSLILSARRVKALGGDGSTAVVALAGGPGQAAQPLITGFQRLLQPLLGGSDLLVYDQRGTGQSNPLQCAALAQPGGLRNQTRACATQLGPARAFFTTAQSVEDIEALRVAGGYSRLVLYGVSYGTKVALAYAAKHPTTTQALILDSVVRPDGPDALRRSTLAAIPRALGEDLCGAGACAKVTQSVVADVRKLAAKLDARPLTGPVLDGSGRRSTARLTVEGLLSILVAGDLDPTLRAELPGSLRAALTGDVKPILRLSARGAGLENAARTGPAPGFQQAAASSEALFFTTLCEESTSIPWTRGDTEAARITQAEAAVRGLPASTFAPFPRDVALSGIPSLCLGWPVASPPPAAPGALPDVPVLILDGASDLRTPVEDARAVGALFPRAQVIAVPHSGHSVLGTEPASCAKDAVAAFAAGGVAAACGPVRNPYAPTPRPPLSLAKVATVRGYTPKVGRTVNAVNSTLNDARRQVIGRALGTGRVPSAVGGLRRGSLRVISTRPLTLRLNGYEYVTGVSLTGTYTPTAGATVRVGGKTAAKGSLTFTFSAARDTVKGTLDGKRVTAANTRSAGVARGLDLPQDTLPSLAEALRRGRFAVAAAGR